MIKYYQQRSSESILDFGKRIVENFENENLFQCFMLSNCIVAYQIFVPKRIIFAKGECFNIYFRKRTPFSEEKPRRLQQSEQ